jgi:hypothetical protein
MISEWWICKNVEGRGRNLILRYNPGIRLEGLRETKKNLSQYSQSPDRDLNPAPPEYEAGVSTTRPRCSVDKCEQCLFKGTTHVFWIIPSNSSLSHTIKAYLLQFIQCHKNQVNILPAASLDSFFGLSTSFQQHVDSDDNPVTYQVSRGSNMSLEKKKQNRQTVFTATHS